MHAAVILDRLSSKPVTTMGVLDLGSGSGSPSLSSSPGSLGSGGSVLGSSETSLMRPFVVPMTQCLGAGGTGDRLE
jgi:hypothetical protein